MIEYPDHSRSGLPGRRGWGRFGLRLPLVWILAFVALLAAGCRPSPGTVETADPTVVAEVGARKITEADLLAEANLRAGNRRSVPDKEALLRDMIQREAVLQRASEVGLDQNPVVRREMENVLIRHLLATELDPKRESISVSSNEVSAEFEAHPERYGHPAQARFAILFRAIAPRATEVTRAEVRRRLEEVASSGASAVVTDATPGGVPGFGSIAAEVSEDQVSRYRGGDIGWLSRGQVPSRIPARVIETGWSLAQGRPSGVLEETNGFYVILKTDVREPGRVSFAAVEPTLRQSLLVRKRKEAEEEYRAGIARRFPSRIHTNVLDALTLPEATSALTASNRQSQPPALPGTTESHHGN